MTDLPRILFGHQRDQVEIRETGYVRTNFAAGYQSLALRFAAEVGYFLTRFSIKKLTTKKRTFWCCSLTKIVAFWDLLLNERYIAAEIWSRRPVFGL